MSPQVPVPVPVSPDRINDILNNLEVKFINCKIIFAKVPIPPDAANSGHNPGHVRTKKKSKNIFSRMLDSGLGTLKDMTNEERNIYTNCIFHPGTEQEIRKQIDEFSSDHLRYTFVNCRFIQRPSRFLENIGLRFRRMIGIVFDLDYLHGCVEIQDYKLKLKYIPEWTQRVIEQVEEDEE